MQCRTYSWEKYELALEVLNKLEEVLETNIIESKYNYDKILIIIILYNLSCCYQKTKYYDKCIQYLDGVIYNFDKKLENKYNIKINEEYFNQNINKDDLEYSLLSELILELRFSAKVHLQLCGVLSEANRHLEALKHAKIARLICEDNIIKTYYLFIQLKNLILKKEKNIINNISDKNKSDKNIIDNEKLELIEQIINNLFNKITNIKNLFYSNDNKKNKTSFDSYIRYRKREIRKNERKNILLNNIRKVFNSEVKNEDWTQLLNIENIMNLSPLNEEDFELDNDPKYEILIDTILEKIVILTLSYYYLAIEMNKLSKDKNNKKGNGEFFLYQAILLIEQYLPFSCSIMKYYTNSYYKYYEKDLEIVPEGKILDYQIQLMKHEVENKNKNKDMQSFVKLQKINYKKADNNINSILNLKINKSIDNKHNINNIKIMKGIKLSHENNYNENKRLDFPIGLKLNLNFYDIINKNKLNDSDNNTPKNTIIITNNNNKIENNLNIKNNIHFNENYQNGENCRLFLGDTHINISEKSKIKEVPKLKLNFNKINNLDNYKDYNKINILKNFQNKFSKNGKINNLYKKIITKISMENNKKGYIDLIKYNFNKNIAYKAETERNKSNNKNINNTDVLIINNKGIQMKKNYFIIPLYSNKYLSKTTRYSKKIKKSPITDRYNIKENLTDRIINNK